MKTETVLPKEAIGTDRNSDLAFVENNKYFSTSL
jgi:hypothetical protein